MEIITLVLSLDLDSRASGTTFTVTHYAATGCLSVFRADRRQWRQLHVASNTGTPSTPESGTLGIEDDY